MADERTTSIKVTETVWEVLHEKKRLGDSFDDVLRRELGIKSVEADHELEAHLATVDLDEAWREVLRAVYAYIRERGEASPGELQKEVFPDASATASNVDWWWKKIGQSGAVEDLPHVERESQRRFVWREEN